MWTFILILVAINVVLSLIIKAGSPKKRGRTKVYPPHYLGNKELMKQWDDMGYNGR